MLTLLKNIAHTIPSRRDIPQPNRKSPNTKRSETPATPSESSVLVLPAKESSESMKKGKHTQKDELRPEYKLSDFPIPMARGKYTKRMKESSNIVVIRPEVAAVFPNEEAVNSALLSLIELARTATRKGKSQSEQTEKRRRLAPSS